MFSEFWSWQCPISVPAIWSAESERWGWIRKCGGGTRQLENPSSWLWCILKLENLFSLLSTDPCFDFFLQMFQKVCYLGKSRHDSLNHLISGNALQDSIPIGSWSLNWIILLSWLKFFSVTQRLQLFFSPSHSDIISLLNCRVVIYVFCFIFLVSDF